MIIVLLMRTKQRIWEKTNPNDSDNYDISGAVKVSEYKKYGDDEIRCKSIEANHSIPVHPEKDWSDKGDQY